MSATIETIAAGPARKPPIAKYIPLPVLIAYAERGMSMAEIGKMVGISHQAVQQRFSAIGYTPAYRREFSEKKAEILEQVQVQIGNALSAADWKKVSPAQMVTCLAILEDKIRLIRGQSTANVSVLSQIIATAHKTPPNVNTPSAENKTIDAQPIDIVDVAPKR